ncbi:MAG TPA: histidine phosphatase family protein [Actinomycetota bacterium]|jgi:probable phosphoglycerate mutase|nr:histidine phosphatase family protein [Actinomycetota bacterium]
MAVLLLIRHAVTDATGKRLYGRAPGFHLSERGREQAGRLAGRLRDLPIAAVYSSPLERCVETAQPVADSRGLAITTVPDLSEVDAGRWTGRTFTVLRRSAGWRRVHEDSAAPFPDGESLSAVQRRVVSALEGIAADHRPDLVAVFSHGDPIRVALAHFAGIHLDLFRRLEVAAASVSAVSVGGGPPRLLRVGDTGDFTDLVPRRRTRRR